MQNSTRWIVLAGLVLAMVWIGSRFTTSADRAMEGTTPLLEVDALPEDAGDPAWDRAELCDAGDGKACGALWSMYEMKRHGLQGTNVIYRRLCRKACEGGDVDACQKWDAGNRACPVGSR